MSGTPSSIITNLRPDLGGSLEQFNLEANMKGMIGTQIFTPFNVPKQSGTYGKITVASLLRNPRVNRTSTGGYHRDNFEFDKAQYATEDYGSEQKVDYRDAARYIDYFNAELVAARLARHAVLLAEEQRCAALAFNTATYTGAGLTAAAAIKWNAVGGTPIDDVDTARIAFLNNTGMTPNAVVMDYELYLAVRKAQQVLDRIAAQGSGDKIKATDVTKQMLAQVFDVDYVLVAKVRSNTAAEGQPASLAAIWDKTKCQVCRVSTVEDITDPCIGRTFHWAADGSQIGAAVETYEDPAVRATIARARHDVQEAITYKEMGFLLTGLL